MEIVTEKDCFSIMEKKLRGKRFDVISFVLQPFSEVMGFHGDHAMLKILAKVEDKEKEYSFFVKMATKSQFVFEEYFGPMRFYFKEHVLMTKVLDELQAQLTKKLTAKCYLSKLDKFIVLENLQEAGFEVIRKKKLDLIHSKIAVETFADFHAASFILESKGIKIEEKYPEIIYETFFVDFPDRDRYLLRSCDVGVRKIASKCCSVSSNILDDIFDKVARRVVELAKPSKKYKNVMCQGDPWGNNIMYKYNGDVPKEGILVDFQTSRFVPPALELMQFLYVATSKSFREENSKALMDVYYSRLARTLDVAGLDVSSYLTRKEFAESCSYYKEFAIGVGLYYAYITRVPGKYLGPAVQDEQVFLDFMIGGVPTIPLEAMQDEEYKTSFVNAVNDAVEFYTSITQTV